MKRILYLFTFSAIMAMFIPSCDFIDKGNYELSPLTDITIDTTGIPLQHVVVRLEELTINPEVYRDGTNEEDFSYEWRITIKPGEDWENCLIIGTEKHLKSVIELIPSASYYSLWYRVKDNTTGLLKSIIWRVVVEASSGQGLVVADSEDGTTSDLSVIQDTMFTYNWYEKGTTIRKPTLYKRNEFSRVHKTKFNGVIHSMFAQRLYQDGRYTNFLHGASRNNAFRINTLDYSIVCQGKELFYDPFIVLDIDYYYRNGSGSLSAYIINSGKVSNRMSEVQSFVGYRKFGIFSPGDYTCNKFIACHPVTSGQAIFYDEGLGKFLKLGTSNTGTAPKEVGAGSSPFNAQNLPGYQVLGGGLGTFTEARFILKKDTYYGVFCLTNDKTSTPRRLFDISNAPNIANAIGFVFPADQSVIYYSTSSKVYSIRIPQGGAAVYTELYTSPEPITMFEMLRKTGTTELPYAERCLLVITYNGTEGKITALPIPSEGLDLGLVDLTRKATFGGFKQISAVAVQD
ncbi:MAG: PKD-like family lipoprotein [Bacteroidales bacterium]|nr:PKD-like family lipoprotein [Bacteroidales bacterium]